MTSATNALLKRLQVRSCEECSGLVPGHDQTRGSDEERFLKPRRPSLARSGGFRNLTGRLRLVQDVFNYHGSGPVTVKNRGDFDGASQLALPGKTCRINVPCQRPEHGAPFSRLNNKRKPNCRRSHDHSRWSVSLHGVSVVKVVTPKLRCHATVS